MKFVVVCIILFPNFVFASYSTNTLKCLTGLKRRLAPYVNLPEYRGAFEHYQIKEVKIPSMKVRFAYYWDEPVEENSKTRTRLIYTLKGAYKCNYPKDLDPSELVFDADSFESGDSDVLKRDRLMMSRYGIDCKPNFNPPEKLIDKYVSWAPQLYEELLLDKTMDKNFSRIAGHYTPQQHAYVAFGRCKKLSGTYEFDIKRKEARFRSTWQSIVHPDKSGSSKTMGSSGTQ